MTRPGYKTFAVGEFGDVQKIKKDNSEQAGAWFFGSVWMILFWLFQAGAVGFFLLSIGAFSETNCAGDLACQVGGVLAGGLWLAGTAVLGVLMLATRGTLVTYTGTDEKADT